MLATLVQSVSLGTVVRERPDSFFWGGIMILLIATLVVWSTFRQFRDHVGTWAAGEKYLASVLSPKNRIHADILSRNALEFFWRYPDEMNVSVYGEPGQSIVVDCNDYVLRNLSYIQWLTTNYGMWLTLRGFELPAAVQNPPENWRIQWTNQNATLFKVVCDYQVQ
jgi:hypothetical protein